MRLKSALRRRSTAELAKIAEAWGCTEGQPREEDGREAWVEHLYPRLQSKTHFQTVWENLSDGKRKLIAFLAIHGGDLGLRELARRSFNGDSKAARKALAPLIEQGLVFRDSDTSALASDEYYGIPDLLLRHIEVYAHFRGYLGQFLQEMSTEELERMANEGLGLKPKSTKRDYLRHLIRHTLLKPSRLRSYLQDLPTEERELFYAILRRGGVCIYSDLIDMGFQRHYDHSRVDTLNRLLKVSGLLFISAKGTNKYADLLIVPKDIARVVRSGFKEDRRSLSQLDTATAGGKHTPSVVMDNGPAVLRDLVIFCDHVRRSGVRRLSNGGIGKNDLKRVLPSLSPGKTLKYARFLGLCVIELGLLVPVGERWQVSEEKLRRWLGDPRRAYADLAQHWLRTSSWNEEFVEGDVLHVDTPVPHLLDIGSIRKIVIEALLNLPHGEWMEFRAFADVVLPKIALAVPRRSQRATGKFNRPPLYIAESIIVDTLHWLGALAIGSENKSHLESVQSRGNLPVGGPRRKLRQRLKSAEDTHLLFKVTPIGAEALRLMSEGKGDLGGVGHLQFAATKFTVQPNHEILVPPDLRLDTFNDLLRLCEVKSVDVMATLCMTRESVRHGLDHGMDAETALALLREGSLVPLPQTVEHLVRECSQRQSSLFIAASGGYMAVEDPVIMAEIRAHRKLKPLIREVVGDQVLIFHPHADMQRVAQEIEKIGHTVETDSEAAVPKENGKISLELSERSLGMVLAAMRFTAALEEDLGVDLSEGRMRNVIKRVQPGGPRHHQLQEYAETAAKKFLRRHGQALRKQIDQATEKHRLRVEKLMGSGPRRQRKKASHSGPSPATEPSDIHALLDYAIEHEMRVEARVKLADGKVLREEYMPESIEGERLYAFSQKRDTHSLVRLSKIVEAKLL